MNLQSFISNYAGYNLWANQQMVKWLAPKPVDLLNQDVPSSFGSILKTLNHIWAVEEFWYATICQKPVAENRYIVEDLFAEEIFKGLINRSTQIVDAVNVFTEAALSENLNLVTPWLVTNQPRYEYIVQLANHATYHRGQIVTIGRIVGLADAPNTDYVNYSAQKARQLQDSEVVNG